MSRCFALAATGGGAAAAAAAAAAAWVSGRSVRSRSLSTSTWTLACWKKRSLFWKCSCLDHLSRPESAAKERKKEQLCRVIISAEILSDELGSEIGVPSFELLKKSIDTKKKKQNNRWVLNFWPTASRRSRWLVSDQPHATDYINAFTIFVAALVWLIYKT